MSSRGEDQLDALAAGAIWGIPELFGFKPPASAQAAMAKAPGTALVGNLLSGTVIPYGGWYKATTKIPRLAKLVDKAGDIGGITAPFAKGAAREIGRFAPLEIARVGIGVPFGDVGIGEAITSSALNLALEGVGGGIAGKLASAGQRRLRGREIIGERAVSDPPQLQLRAIDDNIAANKYPPEKMPEVMSMAKKLDLEVRFERPETKGAFTGNLVSGQNRGALHDLLTDSKGNWSVHRLLSKSEKGSLFESAEQHQNILGSIGVDAAQASRFMRTPRFVQSSTYRGHQAAKAHVVEKLGATDIGDGWWKLDEVDEGFKVLIKEVPPAPKGAGIIASDVNKHGGFFVTVTDMPDWFRPNQATRLMRAVDENMWVRKNYKNNTGLGGKLGRRAIEAYQMLPFRTRQLIRQSGMKFETIANISGIKLGSRSIADNKRIRAAADFVKRTTFPTRFQLKDNPRAREIFGMAEAIKDDARKMAQEVMYGNLTPPRGGPVGDNLISRQHAVIEGKGFAGGKVMAALDALPEASVKKLQELAVDAPMSPERVMHLKIEGAIDEAEETFLLKAEAARQELRTETIENDMKFGGMKMPDYNFSFLSSSGKEILGKQQFRKKLEDRIFSWTDNLSNSILDNLFMGEMRLVDVEDPAVGKILKERMNDLKGKPRELSVIIDQKLSGLLGPDGATGIAQFSNEAMYDLTLAGMNTGYLVMNPIGVFTNVVPRAMYVINGRGLGVGDDLMHWPLPGIGTVGVPDGLKAMRQTFKDIVKPDYIMSEMFDRAVVDNKLLPAVIAEGVGLDSPSKRNIMQLWADGNYVKAMRLGWRMPAARSEQYSRLIAFTTSVRMARLAGLTNHDDIYRVATKILDDSMYGYRQADKPAWMSGPVGGPLGLFKNWTINYMGDMLEYAGAAVRGNWRPLMWQQTSTMAIAGVAGSPVALLASQFNDLFSDNELVQNMYDMAGEEHGGAMMYGLPMYLGFSLTPQGSAPGSNPARDIQALYTPVMYDRVRALTLAGGEAWSRIRTTGDHPAESPELRRLIAEAVAPRTIMRIYQQFMQDDVIASSKTGYPLVKNPTWADRVFYAMGLSTEESQKNAAIADILYKDKARRMALTSGYGEALKDAIEANDVQAQQRLLKRAVGDGLDPNSVARSAATRLKQGDLDQIERAGNPQYRRELLKSFGISP